jgi:hypothetical protein
VEQGKLGACEEGGADSTWPLCPPGCTTPAEPEIWGWAEGERLTTPVVSQDGRKPKLAVTSSLSPLLKRCEWGEEQSEPTFFC